MMANTRPGQALASDSDYDAGVSLKENGKWKAALETWLKAADSLELNGVKDPRIGIAFIELATDRQATQFYRAASRLYLWGFSGEVLSQYKELFGDEVSRIAPLLDETERDRWKKLSEKSDARLFGEIQGFWTRKDPIPTTEINERLIEHWERIAHVKRQFTLENTTSYGTDDRGLIFLKYGAPDEKYGGKLGADQLEIMRWFDDFALRQEIQRFNTTPSVEVWRYTGLKPGETTVFLFGKKGGFGKYGLRYGVEEFLSDRSFRRSSMTTTQGVLPGAMLQLMFYRDLIAVDRFFLDRFRDLEAMWANARGGGKLAPDYDFLRGKIGDYKSRDLDKVRFKYLAKDKTDAFEGLERLVLKYKPFRYLDEDANARLTFMVVSSDEGSAGLDATPFFQSGRMSTHKIRHVLIAYDENWRISERTVDYPALENTNTSTFSFLQDAQTSYALASEKVLFETRQAQLEQADIPDTAKVVGVGSTFVGTVPPLSLEPGGFEVSDFLLGVKSDRPPASYPLPVMPKDPVSNLQPIIAYFEVYRADAEKATKATVRVDYEIKKLRAEGKDEPETVRRSQPLQFEMSGRRMEESFEIDLTDLAAGDYLFVFEISCSGIKGKKERSSYLQIVD